MKDHCLSNWLIRICMKLGLECYCITAKSYFLDQPTAMATARQHFILDPSAQPAQAYGQQDLTSQKWGTK